MSTNRRSFLKFFGLGSVAVPAAAVMGSTGQKQEAKNLLVKEWQQEGITFLEYLLPPSVNALFKQTGRKRAIYCPIKNIDFEYELGVNLHNGLRCYPDVKEKVTKEKLIENSILACKMHRDSKFAFGPNGGWSKPHIYIIRIENHPELLGIMINKDRLEIEVDNYTVYAATDKDTTPA